MHINSREHFNFHSVACTSRNGSKCITTILGAWVVDPRGRSHQIVECASIVQTHALNLRAPQTVLHNGLFKLCC